VDVFIGTQCILKTAHNNGQYSFPRHGKNDTETQTFTATLQTPTGAK